ncbi:MAG: helix-turn-helix transcriptional regulator [Oscillospiraceae bacterium]|nr:helix-turn-helix transcriptional regulator [Oscillospiraceae bacterium]
MPAQWTAEIIGKMHLNSITAKQLAEKAGWNPKYLSTVLNGHRNPRNAEQVLNKALDELIHDATA